MRYLHAAASASSHGLPHFPARPLRGGRCRQLAGRASAGRAGGDRSPSGGPGARVVPLVPAGAPGGAPPGPRHRLPLYLGSFLGRTEATEELATLLRSARLVTLTGTG